jgi:hypothetical protein
VGIPPDRRDLLKILPPELFEVLRQPLPIEARREMLRQLISDELIRVQALRYVEELRLLGEGDDEAAADDPETPPTVQ